MKTRKPQVTRQRHLCPDAFFSCLSYPCLIRVHPWPILLRVDAVEAVLFQAVPEDRHAVEHLAAALEELLAIEVGREVRLLQLLHDVAGVLSLDAVVPGEKRQAQVRNTRLLDLQQTVLDLLPEAGRRPVLDSEAGALGDHRVLAAVDALQFIAEVQRRRSAVPALTEVLV